MAAEHTCVQEAERMTVTVAIPERYVEILIPLGELEKTVDQALQRYAVEQIAARITELRQRDRDFEAKYGCDYEAFIERTARDEEFVREIEDKISKTWELDLAEWEFCHKGIEDWTQRLQTVLLE
jgi:hypothetical protein